MRLFSSFLRGALPFLLLSVLVSCATLSPNGVGRVKRYTVESDRLPAAFDGCRVAFVSDIHYPSLFSAQRLGKLVTALSDIHPDLLLLGGDYVTSDDSIKALFSALETVGARYGTYAVLGNHERRNGGLVASSMREHGIILLSDSIACVDVAGGELFIAGVRDSFSCDSTMIQRIDAVVDEAFLILLAHTPDYAERSSVMADVVLSGHTHGGQVSLLGLYTPVKNSAYGRRFLSGRNATSKGTTVITTNGVGTSRKKVRFCVSSEVVLLTLKRAAR